MLAKLTAHPPWRQLLLISAALPLVVGLAVLAFAWPSARLHPRDLPVGIVGADNQTEHAISALEEARPGAFDLKVYGDDNAAREAIEDRDVYGAIDVSSRAVTIYTATAASPTVATLLRTVGDQIERKLATTTGQPPTKVKAVDVVPTDTDDPRGVVISSSLLPLTICSIIIAAAIALALEFGPAWRMTTALVSVSALAGLGIYLVAETYLGVLPHNGLQTWASLSLLMLAMSSSAAGLITLIGSPGLGIAAATLVFIGNPFAGASSAPELLPDSADKVGQLLPPGAGANLVRSVTYFDGNGSAAHLVVLLAWTAFGLAAVFSGHHSFIGFAARRQIARQAANPARVGPPTMAGPPPPHLTGGEHDHAPQHAGGRIPSSTGSRFRRRPEGPAESA